jgi:hypothetical protein
MMYCSVCGIVDEKGEGESHGKKCTTESEKKHVQSTPKMGYPTFLGAIREHAVPSNAAATMERKESLNTESEFRL